MAEVHPGANSPRQSMQPVANDANNNAIQIPELSCANGWPLMSDFICDGQEDCPDSSDEVLCGPGGK